MLKIKVKIEDDFKIMILLNIGTKINEITRKIIEDARLAIKQKPKLELILNTGHSQLIFNLYKDVEIAIGGLKTKHSIFV